MTEFYARATLHDIPVWTCITQDFDKLIDAIQDNEHEIDKVEYLVKRKI